MLLSLASLFEGTNAKQTFSCLTHNWYRPLVKAPWSALNMIWMIMRCADQSHIVMYFLSGTPNMHLYACNTAYFIMRIHSSSGFYTTWNWKSNFEIYVIMLLQLLSMSWFAIIAVIIWISRPFMIKLKDKGTRSDQFSNACVCLYDTCVEDVQWQFNVLGIRW